MTKAGFTGTRGYELAGTVHGTSERLDCSCGGWVWVDLDGDLISHSEPVDTGDEHFVVPFWSESIWRYELVE